jgi:hypothetical protein
MHGRLGLSWSMSSVEKHKFCLVKASKPCPTDYDSHHRPMAAMAPHSWRNRIQQSANMLGDCCMWRRWEWGTMAAAVDHLCRNVSTELWDFCDVCFC